MQNKFTSKLQAKRKNSFCRRLITFTAFLFISIFLPSFPDHLLFNNSFKVLLERFDASCLNRFSLEYTPWAVCVTFAMKHFFAQYILLKKKKKNQQSFSRPSLISSYPNLSKWSLQGWREIPSKISLIYFHLSHWVEFYTQASRCSLLCISKNTPRASSRIVQSACTQISQ